MEEKIKVYVRTNENNEIVEIASSIFLKNTKGWIKIDEGFGDKYAHAQSQYLEKPLSRIDGGFVYKLVGNKVKEI